MSATFQPDGSRPPKSTSGLKVVLIVLAVLAVLALLVCAGLIGLGFFAFNKGQEMAGAEFKSQLEGNPVLVQEIGELQTVNVSIVETAKRQQEDASGTPRMVMRVEGTEGKGVVVATLSNDGRNRITAATLETEDGRSVELPIEDDATSLDDMDIDAGEPVEEDVVEGEVEEPADAEAEPAAL